MGLTSALANTGVGSAMALGRVARARPGGRAWLAGGFEPPSAAHLDAADPSRAPASRSRLASLRLIDRRCRASAPRYSASARRARARRPAYIDRYSRQPPITDPRRLAPRADAML